MLYKFDEIWRSWLGLYLSNTKIYGNLSTCFLENPNLSPRASFITLPPNFSGGIAG
jgi:hypothetical protein